MLTHLVRNAGRGRRSAMVAAGRSKRVGYSHHLSLPTSRPRVERACWSHRTGLWIAKGHVDVC